MYATHYIAISIVFKRLLNDERKVHVECSVDMAKRGFQIRKGSIRLCGLCDDSSRITVNSYRGFKWLPY